MSEALRHGGAANKTKVCINYLEAEKFEQNPQCIDELKAYDGIFVPYGFGHAELKEKSPLSNMPEKTIYFPWHMLWIPTRNH